MSWKRSFTDPLPHRPDRAPPDGGSLLESENLRQLRGPVERHAKIVNNSLPASQGQTIITRNRAAQKGRAIKDTPMHPLALLNTKQTYDQHGLAYYDIVFFTKEIDAATGKTVESAHCPIMTMLMNRPEARWGAVSGPWLRYREATAWGWTPFTRRPTPGAAERTHCARGRIISGPSGTKENSPTTTHFLSFASEDQVPTWDTYEGVFNPHPLTNAPEPLNLGNVWALKSLFTEIANDPGLAGKSEISTRRWVWINQPPDPHDANADTPGEDGPASYARNRELLYSLASRYELKPVEPNKPQIPPAARDKNPGKIVYWRLE